MATAWLHVVSLVMVILIGGTCSAFELDTGCDLCETMKNPYHIFSLNCAVHIHPIILEKIHDDCQRLKSDTAKLTAFARNILMVCQFKAEGAEGDPVHLECPPDMCDPCELIRDTDCARNILPDQQTVDWTVADCQTVSRGEPCYSCPFFPQDLETFWAVMFGVCGWTAPLTCP